MAKRRTRTELIVLHCSATPPDGNVSIHDIDRWHEARGWEGIGYHFYIPRRGEILRGRDLYETGAHTRGYNYHSIGICLEGGIDSYGSEKPEANYTRAQWDSLDILVSGLLHRFPTIREVKGHNNFSTKACPSFSVAKWVADHGIKVND